VFEFQGIIQHSGSLLIKDALPKTLCWHPSKRILAVGWLNGEITMWNDHEKETHVASQLHTATVSNLLWTSNGNRLGTCDTVN